MEYKYFTLDKNPKQFKRISIGEYSIELRIEWNTRSKAWYVLGYSGDEIVISNVKMTPNQLYSIDIDSEYDLPYMIGIIPKYTNYDWDTETTFLIVDNPLSNAVEGLTVDGGVIKRSIATSSDTHSRKALKGTENKYLFDVVSITQETGITIVCNGAAASFKTVNLPQGRWDFTINGLRTITADTDAFRSLMNDYGVQIVDVGNNEYLWANNSDHEIKIEGLYPYAAGYDFNIVESSNESAKIHSVDNNGWVNRFTVCLSPFVDTVWEVYKTEVSEDYNDLVFRARKSLTGVKPSEEEALLEKYKSGLDPYTATIVDELTGVSDWVLDSANNRIGYFELEDEVDDVDGVASFGCNGSTSNSQTLQSALDSCTLSNWTQVELTEKGNETLVNTLAGMQVGQTKSTLLLEVSVVNINNSNPTPVVTNMYLSVTKLGQPAEQEEKYLPLSTVVAQVISNAVNGDVNAEELLNSLNKYDSYAEVEILPLIVDRHKQGIDVYSSGVVNELTGVSDWVLDSDNNQIKYSEPQTLNPTNISKAWCYNDGVYNCFGSPTSAKNYFKSFYPQFPADFIWEQQTDIHWYLVIREKKESTKGGRSVSFHYVNNPFYNPAAEEPEQKTLPLPVVAQQVISNAESGNIDAQKVALSAALSPSLVSSLSDSDMQQWQAVKDAIGQLTGATEWTFDNAAKVVRYQDLSSIPEAKRYKTSIAGGPTGWYPTKVDACQAASSSVSAALGSGWAFSSIFVEGSLSYCRFSNNSSTASYILTEDDNPDYDPNYVPPLASITYQQIAERIAQNSKSVDQSIVLSANSYIQEALLKFTDVDSIKSQFEANKQPK